jgi:hypothetical protein
VELQDRYLHALETVLAEIQAETEPVGILLTGSVIHGNAAATSDLDVAILHDQSWRQRVQRVVDGVPVECFINSHAWWMHTLDSEAATGRSPAAHFLARGVIWRDNDGRMRELQHTAQRYVDAGPQVSEATLVTLRYTAVSTLEDGTDIVTIDADRARWLLYDAIDKALRYHYLHNQIWIPREKDLFLDVDQRWAGIGAFVREAYVVDSVVALGNIATEIVRTSTGETRCFDWSSPRQELDSL